ncbi:hypothetical protein J5X84_38020 [Streptosporangiaceae bacterium NEAU-GS5]|nr:hypothetical protein [Streptosporangiaceae bacterium NEAU-GS5]
MAEALGRAFYLPACFLHAPDTAGETVVGGLLVEPAYSLFNQFVMKIESGVRVEAHFGSAFRVRSS